MNKCKECNNYIMRDGVQKMHTDCMLCQYYPREDMFKKKTNLLANLFDGAPVMVRNYDAKHWDKRYWKEGKDTYCTGTTDWNAEVGTVEWDEIRLPDVDEAPRNVWLAAPGDGSIPEGIDDFYVFVWIKLYELPHPDIYKGHSVNWKKVERYMILEK